MYEGLFGAPFPFQSDNVPHSYTLVWFNIFKVVEKMSPDSVNELRAAVRATPLPFPTNAFLYQAFLALDRLKSLNAAAAGASAAGVPVNIAASGHTIAQTSSNGIAEEVDGNQD